MQNCQNRYIFTSQLLKPWSIRYSGDKCKVHSFHYRIYECHGLRVGGIEFVTFTQWAPYLNDINLKKSSNWVFCSPFLLEGSSNFFSWPVMGTTVRGKVPKGKRGTERLALIHSLSSDVLFRWEEMCTIILNNWWPVIVWDNSSNIYHIIVTVHNNFPVT